jgi:hypothetical protein
MSDGGMPGGDWSIGGKGLKAIGGIIQGAGQIFSGFASADADREEAAYYKKAAGWEKYSTDIKEMSFNRQLYQTLGTGRADIASSGLKISGSAADVMRQNAAEGAVTRNIIGLQGEIDEQGLLAQAKAAEDQATGAEVGGTLGGIGTILGSLGS